MKSKKWVFFPCYRRCFLMSSNSTQFLWAAGFVCGNRLLTPSCSLCVVKNCDKVINHEKLLEFGNMAPWICSPVIKMDSHNLPWRTSYYKANHPTVIISHCLLPFSIGIIIFAFRVICLYLAYYMCLLISSTKTFPTYQYYMHNIREQFTNFVLLQKSQMHFSVYRENTHDLIYDDGFLRNIPNP